MKKFPVSCSVGAFFEFAVAAGEAAVEDHDLPVGGGVQHRLAHVVVPHRGVRAAGDGVGQREAEFAVKVGGHQASSASMVTAVPTMITSAGCPVCFACCLAPTRAAQRSAPRRVG